MCLVSSWRWRVLHLEPVVIIAVQLQVQAGPPAGLITAGGAGRALWSEPALSGAADAALPGVGDVCREAGPALSRGLCYLQLSPQQVKCSVARLEQERLWGSQRQKEWRRPDQDAEDK